MKTSTVVLGVLASALGMGYLLYRTRPPRTDPNASPDDIDPSDLDLPPAVVPPVAPFPGVPLPPPPIPGVPEAPPMPPFKKVYTSFEDLPTGTVVEAKPQEFWAPSGRYRIIGKEKRDGLWWYKGLNQTYQGLPEASFNHLDVLAAY